MRFIIYYETTIKSFIGDVNASVIHKCTFVSYSGSKPLIPIKVIAKPLFIAWYQVPNAQAGSFGIIEKKEHKLTKNVKVS